MTFFLAHMTARRKSYIIDTTAFYKPLCRFADAHALHRKQPSPQQPAEACPIVENSGERHLREIALGNPIVERQVSQPLNLRHTRLKL